MRHVAPLRPLVGVAVAISVAVASAHAQQPPAATAAATVDFTAEVAPLLARRCYACHGPDHQRSDFRLDVKDAALHGGAIGGAIIPGDAAASRLLRYVTGADPEIRMPPKGEPLSDGEVATLRRWIEQGAPWPATPDAPAAESPVANDDAARARATSSDHWAYQPLTRPNLPATVNAHWIRNPVDAFILAALEARGLHPAPPADRRTWLRRVTIDLTGLLPTAEELADFLADTTPAAFDRVVDRLLASPRHGERQARRWMDLVHFAETHGNDQDRERPHAWPYRDWLIDAFNADLPYAAFVQQQLAADVLFPDDPRAVPALGFLAAGPWDESSQLNILDDTQDKAAARNLDRDDVVTTTMSTFASTTVHCARCHDHKFDPIAQRDYYRLQAVFAGIDRADRPYDLDPALHARRQALLRRRLELERAPAEAPQFATPDVVAAVSAWEQSLAGVGAPWQPIVAASVTSTAGQSATAQADGSLLFGGALPETDTVAIVAAAPLSRITALRLDLLPDESLPFRGPGRQDNGNLHLNELTLFVQRADDAVAQPVAFAAASADFDQDGWTSAMAIDGRPETAWGIWPQVGRPHHAVFELATPLDLDPSATLIVTLAEVHGRHHLIGRLRLAVTDAPAPVRATRLPEAIQALLAVAPAARSAAQSGELARHRLLQRIEDELATLPPPQLVYAGTTDFAPENHFVPARGPRPIRILARGDVAKPGAAMTPGALACLRGLSAELELRDADDEGERRAALARWLTDPRQPLTWRSIVNRVWQWHFGRGLVATPNDFGAMGAAPSHPELLDWLATWFLDHGGSLKELDRLLVTSAAYRQSSAPDPVAAAQDGDDALLWRMNRARLDAETIRDATLQCAGVLDLAMGGPSVKQFVESPGIHVTPKVDYDAFDVDSDASHRRSVYRFLFRTLADPFMETLDCPDASQLTPARGASVTALQALALLHDRFLVRMSERIGALAAADATDRDAQVVALFRRVLLRPPDADEARRFRDFVRHHGLADAARVLLNCSEFVFVE